MTEKIMIATIKSWNISNALKFKHLYRRKYNTAVITKKEDLEYGAVKRFNPRYIFFPHWSWMIPKDIYENFECVVFHMTNLPFGRGGSPLQNLIIKGITRTKISAIRVVEGLDAGQVYFKKPLSLIGSAQEIYKRFSRITFTFMIPYILKNNPKPMPQKGKITIFKRRTPQESRIPYDIGLEGLYDYIRMLDAEGYPRAFIDTENLHLEFCEAKKENNIVKAKVIISKKEKEIR